MQTNLWRKNKQYKTKKRVTTKILKMDENNQYGNAMTKPLPYVCIKKMTKIRTLSEFNAISNSLSHTDKIDHLFIVDIKSIKRKINNKTIKIKKRK